MSAYIATKSVATYAPPHFHRVGSADLFSKVCGCSIAHRPKAADLKNRSALPASSLKLDGRSTFKAAKIDNPVLLAA
jgi:hypothetical protein